MREDNEQIKNHHHGKLKRTDVRKVPLGIKYCPRRQFHARGRSQGREGRWGEELQGGQTQELLFLREIGLQGKWRAPSPVRKCGSPEAHFGIC